MNLRFLEKIEDFVEVVKDEDVSLSLFAETDLNELENLTHEMRSYFEKTDFQPEFEEYESIA